jgi:Baseplate J-like protein
VSFSQLGLPVGFGATFAGDPEEVPNPNAQMAVEETTLAKPDIETDKRTIFEQICNSLAARVPGWIAHDGNLEVWLIEDFSTVAAAIRAEAITVPEAIFVTYGEEVLGIPIPIPKPAIGSSNWTALTAMGYSIPAGTRFTLPKTGDQLVVFEVTSTAEIKPGDTAVQDVAFQAVDPGTFANGLVGAGEVVDPLSWVDTIDVPLPTEQGDDGQTVEQYLNLLVMLMRVIALRPILPWDYAVLALRVAGVGRAVAMDGYEPSDGTWGHQRQITLVVTAPDGTECPQKTKDTVKQSLEALREVNFTVHVIDPEYLVVDVNYTVTAFAEQDPQTVVDLCDQALKDELSPATFRLGTTSPSIAAGEVIPPQEAGAAPGRQTLHLNDFIGLLDRQRGVDWVDAVALNGTAADVLMGSPITLPKPGTITGTVNVQ